MSKAESRLFHYINYKNFQFFVFKTDLNNASRCCPSSYNDFDHIFIFTLNHQAPKKEKVIRGNHNPHMNKEIRKAIMLRSKLKNKAHKSKTTADIEAYKK